MPSERDLLEEMARHKSGILTLREVIRGGRGSSPISCQGGRRTGQERSCQMGESSTPDGRENNP